MLNLVLKEQTGAGKNYSYLLSEQKTMKINECKTQWKIESFDKCNECKKTASLKVVIPHGFLMSFHKTALCTEHFNDWLNGELDIKLPQPVKKEPKKKDYEVIK